MTHDLSSNSSPSQGKEIVLVAEESKSFVEFEQWMDTQLVELVARWIHAAAPNASRSRRSTGLLSNSK